MFVSTAFAQTGGELNSEVGIAGEDHAPGFPPFDSSTFPSQILWLVISFGLFYLFLSRVAMPRIGSILEIRRDRIAQDLDQAARMKDEADAAVAAYEQELAEARSTAHGIGEKARDVAKAEAEAERKRIEADLDVKLQEAEARIGSIRDDAMRDVGAIAEETATAIVQELIGGRADKAAVAAAIRSARN